MKWKKPAWLNKVLIFLRLKKKERVFRPIVMPTVRGMAPNLLASQIVGVQPMSAPSGQVFSWGNRIKPLIAIIGTERYTSLGRTNDVVMNKLTLDEQREVILEESSYFHLIINPNEELILLHA